MGYIIKDESLNRYCINDCMSNKRFTQHPANAKVYKTREAAALAKSKFIRPVVRLVILDESQVDTSYERR